jgi:hypothetical protein
MTILATKKCKKCNAEIESIEAEGSKEFNEFLERVPDLCEDCYWEVNKHYITAYKSLEWLLRKTWYHSKLGEIDYKALCELLERLYMRNFSKAYTPKHQLNDEDIGNVEHTLNSLAKEYKYYNELEYVSVGGTNG